MYKSLLFSSFLAAQSLQPIPAATDSLPPRKAPTEEEALIVSGFSPNGDGQDDFLTIKNIDEFPNNKIFVFDRLGNQVLNKEYYFNDWDGTYQGKTLPEDTYLYIFDDGKGRTSTGYVQLYLR